MKIINTVVIAGKTQDTDRSQVISIARQKLSFGIPFSI